MTPKEKAEDLLYNSYENMMYDYIENVFARERLAKQCALIAVEEILNNDGFTRHDKFLTEYWNQVKQEIENL